MDSTQDLNPLDYFGIKINEFRKLMCDAELIANNPQRIQTELETLQKISDNLSKDDREFVEAIFNATKQELLIRTSLVLQQTIEVINERKSK